MITSFLLGLLDRVVAYGLGGLPIAPEWLTGSGASVAGVLQNVADGVARWGFIVPFDVIGDVFPIAVAAWALAILIRVARIVLSYLTLGGGM